MLMSRWLDDEVIASGPDAAPLRLHFWGSMALLFGESTPLSGHYRVSVDDGVPADYDAGLMGVKSHGSTHLWQVAATGLDPNREHTLEITPVLQPGQEMRLESVCVAGGRAEVSRDH